VALITNAIRSEAVCRDVTAAMSLKVGEDSLPHWNGQRRVIGHVVRIYRSHGRVVVIADFGEGTLSPFTLPGSMVKSTGSAIENSRPD